MVQRIIEPLRFWPPFNNSPEWGALGCRVFNLMSVFEVVILFVYLFICLL